MTRLARALLSGAILLTVIATASADGLANATVLVVRHAEKPATGRGLSPTGEQRAQAYVGCFEKFHLDCLIAGADSPNSMRPRLTLEPLAAALKLKIDSRFSTKDVPGVVKYLRTEPHGRNVLICWRHGELPDLLRALGADPAHMIGSDTWPEDTFCWLITLRYDADGKLIESKRTNEQLLPGDAARK